MPRTAGKPVLTVVEGDAGAGVDRRDGQRRAGGGGGGHAGIVAARPRLATLRRSVPFRRP